LVDDCPTAFSFTSSHATNHFALAVFFMCSLGFVMKRYKYIWLLWAFLVAYGQVYIGVHYPTDVIFGALIGIAVGTFIVYLYKQLHLKIYNTLPPL
jgi:undecaprenyl-diphosphatase